MAEQGLIFSFTIGFARTDPRVIFHLELRPSQKKS